MDPRINELIEFIHNTEDPIDQDVIDELHDLLSGVRREITYTFLQNPDVDVVIDAIQQGDDLEDALNEELEYNPLSASFDLDITERGDPYDINEESDDLLESYL